LHDGGGLPELDDEIAVKGGGYFRQGCERQILIRPLDARITVDNHYSREEFVCSFRHGASSVEPLPSADAR